MSFTCCSNLLDSQYYNPHLAKQINFSRQKQQFNNHDENIYSKCILSN